MVDAVFGAVVVVVDAVFAAVVAVVDAVIAAVVVVVDAVIAALVVVVVVGAAVARVVVTPTGTSVISRTVTLTMIVTPKNSKTAVNVIVWITATRVVGLLQRIPQTFGFVRQLNLSCRFP